jgi:hypothetical protein
MLNHELGSNLIGLALCREGEVRHTCNGWKRFAAEPKRGDFEEVIRSSDFACRVALYGKDGINWAHPTAIVPNDNQAASTILDVDIDSRSTSIHGILDELFDDTARTLHDFAGGNLVARVVIEQANRRIGIPNVA